MFCPRCRSEYRAGFTRCAHCEVDLVPELPPADLYESPEAMARVLEGKDTQPIMVGSHVDLAQVQRFLGRQQILSVLASEADQEVDAPMHQRLYLMVAADDLERARAVIQRQWRDGAISQGLVSKDGGGPVSDAVCPACGAAVPASASECPDCGLFVGAAEGEAEKGEEAG